MCGIFGIVFPGAPAQRLSELLPPCRDTMAHRGPDGAGGWFDPAGDAALGHRRLAVIDLSEHGRQPMVSKSGDLVLTLNGEIYNYLALRAELVAAGETFVGTSDTEVLLAGFERWGVERTLERANGMFALGLWDRRHRRLVLARDRFGEKPLYYGRIGGAFAFASELKALAALPGFVAEVDRGALGLFFRYAYVPAPWTIYRGIRKLPAASTLSLDLAGGKLGDEQVRAYWDLTEVALAGRSRPFEGSPGEAIDKLERMLAAAVASRMVSDVPVGAFLSGGVDSSTVVALMQAASPRPVRTFSVGFEIDGWDEAPHARAVAAHLGTDHTEIYVGEREALAVIPRLPQVYDEPFADSSQIPTWLVAQLARRSVTVALSGDGGDELFRGYTRYHLASQMWRQVGWMPRSVRRAAAALVARVPTAALDRGFGWLGPAFARWGRPGSAGDKLHKAAEVARMGGPDELYRHLVTHWREAGSLVLGAEAVADPLAAAVETRLEDLRWRMPLVDQRTYLPDDVLVKVDRASMAHGLEARVPLLDPEIAAFAWSLPLGFGQRAGQSKWLLRQVLARHVPRQLTDRPKMGFGVPVGDWLRGPLRDWAEALLDENRLRREGQLDPAPIRARWREHLEGRRNWQYHLWDVLTWQAWLETWRGSRVQPSPGCAAQPAAVAG